jgi:hypothetical protein
MVDSRDVSEGSRDVVDGKEGRHSGVRHALLSQEGSATRRCRARGGSLSTGTPSRAISTKRPPPLRLITLSP